MSDKNINWNLQRTTLWKSKVLAEAEKSLNEKEKNAFHTDSKLVHSLPLKSASTKTLGTSSQNFSEFFNETFTYDNKLYPILNHSSVGKDHSNQTNPNLTPLYKKINFQIKGSSSLEYL